MQIFLDTANYEEIVQAAELGVISGVTTNPSLVAKEKGQDFSALLKKIAELVEGPVSAEVLALTAPEMIKEARPLAALASNIVIKIPMTQEGLKAVKILSGEGIKTNVTLIYSVNQALLAALAGATFVSPFVGRLDDISYDGIALLADIADVFKGYAFSTRIIGASIRHPLHVVEAAKVGADIVTIPYKVLLQMVDHPLTKIGIERFLADWAQSQKKD